MRYLTKKWYATCQQTGSHFGMRAHKGAGVYDESLYLRLYERKEKEYIKMQQEVYDMDPRFFLEQDQSTFVRLDALVKGDEISEEDKMVVQLSQEQKNYIQQLITEFDARPPFDKENAKIQFRMNQKSIQHEVVNKLPKDLLLEIADIRVFALGYCTHVVMQKLKSISKVSKKEVTRVMGEYIKAKEAEDIPEYIKSNFCFHDCVVTALTVGKDITIHLDTQGGFTNHDSITFMDAHIEKMDEGIVGGTWLYEELYALEAGFEAHMLFYTDEGTVECIIHCTDLCMGNK